MVDIRSVVETMERDNQFANIVNNPAAQFGTEDTPLLGAELLPEDTKTENSYDEYGIRYRTPVANDGTRYSPVQKKKGVLSGHFHVSLSNQDIGSEFTAQDYDAFVHLLSLANDVSDTRTMEAMAQLSQFVDRTINIPLRHKIEKMRWEAIVEAQVVRAGDNGYSEVITYSNPTGHRISAGDWTDPDVDPYVEMMDMVDFLKGKGFTVSRIIAGTPVISKLAMNAKMRQRMGLISIVAGTSGGNALVTGLAGRAQLEDINRYVAGDGLPPIERYDSQYHKDIGSAFFLRRDAMVFVCTTPRQANILNADDQPVILPNTLGYVGVGRPTGATGPGRVVFVNPKLRSKPPHIEAEGWQTTLPVIGEPEAIGVLIDI
jgi:hypothetical protein